MKREEYRLNYELIHRFTGIFGSRKMISPFSNVSTSINFNSGWRINYNFFKPNKNTGGRTPAEAAGYDMPLKSWSDLVRNNRVLNYI